MESSKSPQLPTPSIFETESHTRAQISSTGTFSDDWEALLCLEEEATVRKSKLREVIQHRAWKLGEIFANTEENSFESPLKYKTNCQYSVVSVPPTSSSLDMPFHLTSDSDFPSSPSFLLKRPPCANSTGKERPQVIGGFLIDNGSDNENEILFEEPPSKRQRKNPDFIGEVLELANNVVPESAERLATDILERPSKKKESKTLNDSIKAFVRPSQPIGLTSTFMNEVISSQETPTITEVTTFSGKVIPIKERHHADIVPIEQIIAQKSTTKAGRAKKNYYGIPLYELIDEAKRETEEEKEKNHSDTLSSYSENRVSKNPSSRTLWTEKYRARNFMELMGDNRIHRQVLRWFKAWDPIVFSGSRNLKTTVVRTLGTEDEKRHRKILLLAGAPGLGKTTMAHVCARQAGYDVVEINASDERNRGVVNNRIKTCVGTECVKTGSQVKSKSGLVETHAHPMCVIVDEVDGVDGGTAGSGDGGFIKALIDLCHLDQKNCSAVGKCNTNAQGRKKKFDNFKFLRPLILICNDLYHPSLRLLRQSSFAEIIHVKKPNLDTVITRMKSVFEKEAIFCDEDAVRRLCEATWEVNTSESRKGKEGSCEGDLRSILIVGEWAARKLKESKKSIGKPRLTRKWVEDNITSNTSQIESGMRGVGRGGAREVVKRVFIEGAGFPRTTSANKFDFSSGNRQTQLGVSELAKKAGMSRLREMVESNDVNRIIIDIFSQYPNQSFNDDSMLSKPDAAYEWLHFYDSCSSQVFSDQKFELMPYLSQPVLACHHLFASPARHNKISEGIDSKVYGDDEKEKNPVPFTGPRADFDAHETEKSNRAIIQALLAGFDAAHLRSFRTSEHVATDFLPYLVRILSPGVKPILVGGSAGRKSVGSVRKENEKVMIDRAVNIMINVGIIFEEGKLEAGSNGDSMNLVYFMEPPLDNLVLFDTANKSLAAPSPVRYAVRQVIDQEYRKQMALREKGVNYSHYPVRNRQGNIEFSKKDQDQEISPPTIFKDFFGRIIEKPTLSNTINAQVKKFVQIPPKRTKVWVTFNEGFSNAVKKPITIDDLLRGL